MIKNALEIIEEAKTNECELILPSDVITAKKDHGDNCKSIGTGCYRY